MKTNSISHPLILNAIKYLKCVDCNNLVFIFNDENARQIYSVTGLCQSCQTKLFKGLRINNP